MTESVKLLVRLSDSLQLSPQTICTALVYLHKYEYFYRIYSHAPLNNQEIIEDFVIMKK